MEIITVGQQPRPSTMPEFLPAHAAMPVATMLALRLSESQSDQLISNQLRWRELGQICVEASTSKAQDGHIAGFGGYDVTDTTKFSTRVGPPSCSPPV